MEEAIQISVRLQGRYREGRKSKVQLKEHTPTWAVQHIPRVWSQVGCFLRPGHAPTSSRPAAKYGSTRLMRGDPSERNVPSNATRAASRGPYRARQSQGLRVGCAGHAVHDGCGRAGHRETGTAAWLVLPGLRVTTGHECREIAGEPVCRP